MGKLSIATKKGDAGFTSLMFGRSVPKHNLRVEAYGSVDELNASLGLIRASKLKKEVKSTILQIQEHTFLLNAELATTLYDNVSLPKKRIGQDQLAFLQNIVDEIENNYDFLRNWAIPGDNWNGALFDMARTICRRAERHVVALDRKNMLDNKYILQYLNRLSDVLWLMARKETLGSSSSLVYCTYSVLLLSK